MSGWFALAAIGLAVCGALWLAAALGPAGVSRVPWPFVGAALVLGAAGYARQGSPALPGDPVTARTMPIALDPDLTDLRDTMLGRYTADGAYISAADAVARSGDTYLATRAILGGIARYPRSLSLWTALGTTLALNDGDTVSPASSFAFRRAAQLAPLHPAPPFFLGLASVRAGDFQTARRYWTLALKLTPPALPYRGEIALRLALLDRYLAIAAQLPPN